MTKTALDATALDVAADAVDNCLMPDGDQFGVLVHSSPYIDDSVPVSAQLKQVRAICRTIALAAITAYQEHAHD